MAQVMVNFRMDEDVKRSMEQACKEMGLSMTTAFTIFATKVGKEKRIPFEISAAPAPAGSCGRPLCSAGAGLEAAAPPAPELSAAALGQKREGLELLCGEIRRSLTSIHTAIPASVPGLSIQRIQLLCADELKEKTAAAASAFRSVLSDRNTQVVQEKDLGVLDEYIAGLSSVAEEVGRIERTLVPALRSWSGSALALEPFEQRLTAVSRQFDELHAVMQSFVQSAARRQGTARCVQARIQRAAAMVSDPEVKAAADSLETLVRRYYDSLGQQAKAHLESFYLQTLELVLEELGRAERDGGDTAAKAALCLRVTGVLSQVVNAGSRAQRELSQRSLEAEVVALERLAAMRGDVSGSMGAEL